MDVRACLFDVFGTVVDWRTSVSREFAAFAQAKGITGVDPVEFAVEWRKLYHPSMEEVRSGRRPFTRSSTSMGTGAAAALCDGAALVA